MKRQMKRQTKQLSVTSLLHGKMIAVATIMSLSVAQASPEAVNDGISAGQIAISVIATGAAILSGETAIQQNTISRQRLGPHSTAIVDGSGTQISMLPKVTSSEFILKGTVPGDVIRIEYIAGDEATLGRAVSDLKSSVATWEARVALLKADREIMAERATEARRVFTSAPLNEQSKGLRLALFEEFSRQEKALKIHEKILADADMRMHGARSQFHSANMNLDVTQKTHVITSRHRIILDVLVDAEAPAKLQTFFAQNLEVGQAARASAGIPHMRVVRIQSPNLSVASKAASVAKAGLVGVVLMGGIAIEEIVVDGIGQYLENRARTQLAPEARTEPKN